MNTHDTDFYMWTQSQAALLRANNFTALDIDNLIDEIEDMGISQKRELESRLAVLLMHLLKWCYQPNKQSASWRFTIQEQRRKTRRVLKQNPSLKHRMSEVFIDAYEDARGDAVSETGLEFSIFPIDCPWTFDQVMNDEFWPN